MRIKPLVVLLASVLLLLCHAAEVGVVRYNVSFPGGDLTSFDGQGKVLEFADAREVAKRGMKLAQKREIVELRKLGWQQEKVKGLVLIDNRTLAVINDNDFGLQAKR